MTALRPGTSPPPVRMPMRLLTMPTSQDWNVVIIGGPLAIRHLWRTLGFGLRIADNPRCNIEGESPHFVERTYSLTDMDVAAMVEPMVTEKSPPKQVSKFSGCGRLYRSGGPSCRARR